MSNFGAVNNDGQYVLSGKLTNALIRKVNTPEAAAQEKNPVGGRDTDCVGVLYAAASGASAGTVVGLGSLATEAASIDDTDAPDLWLAQMPVYNAAPYNAETHGDRLAVLLAPASGSGKSITLAATAGTVKIRINIADAAHKYAKLIDPQPSSGAQLESAASGPFRIVSQPSGTGAKWCTVQFPAGRPENIHAADADNAFTIDRTSEADDAAAWNPGANEPADWADYDCVKLILGFLRYDSTAGTLKHVKQEMHWHAANAPIIPAAEIVDADVGVCDSAGGGEEEPPA